MLSAQCPPSPYGPGWVPPSCIISLSSLLHCEIKILHAVCTSIKDSVISPSFSMAVIRAWDVRDCRCLPSHSTVHSVGTVTPVSFTVCVYSCVCDVCWCECCACDCPVSQRRWLLKTLQTRCWRRSQRKDITVVPRWQSWALDRSAWPPPLPWWHRSDFSCILHVAYTVQSFYQ